MRRMLRFPLAPVALTCLGVALIATTAITQSGGAVRQTISETALPAVDRGLRLHDAPKEPGGNSERALMATVAEDGSRVAPVYESGGVIVKFRAGAGPAAVSSAMRQVEALDVDRPTWANFDIMEIPADADPEDVAAELRARPDVEYAQPRYRIYPMLRPNDPLYSQQWNFPAIDMERAWDIQPNAGGDVIVAVLDTGVAFTNRVVRYPTTRAWRFVNAAGQTIASFPSLGAVDVPYAVAPELGAAKFVAPRDFIWDDTLPFDLVGHGTHVAGTIGQLTNNSQGVAGMAFNVRIMPIKVLSSMWDFIFANDNGGTDDVLARGIRYAADNNAKVINMSLGRTGGGAAPVVEDAIRYAISRGAVVVVASGNTADEGNAPNRIGDNGPSIAGMIVVASVGRALERAYYSTFNTSVEIAAPGGDQRRDGNSGGIVQQTVDTSVIDTYFNPPYRAPRGDVFAYEFYQGTSMATPHVAGFAAMLIQQGITSPAAVEAAIKQFARDLGPAGVDSQYGSGLIQPRATLRGLGLAR